MKSALWYCLGFVCCIGSAAQSLVDPVPFANTISATELSKHLHVLASDSLEGRETGEKGQKLAAQYIAQQFESYGIKPLQQVSSNAPSYFQNFVLIKKHIDSIIITTPNGTKKKYLEDFFSYGAIHLSASENFEAYFAGYGIDDKKYSDYSHFKKNKFKTSNPTHPSAFIIFTGEPMLNGKSLITGDSTLSNWGNDWRLKVSTAKRYGATHVFIISRQDEKTYYETLRKNKHHFGQPSLAFKEKSSSIGAFFITPSTAAELLGISTAQLFELRDKQVQLVLSGKKIPPIKNNIHINASCKTDSLLTENVLGYIEGTDKKEELIIITAHYDHLGKEGNTIYYGADDDASGTAALLEIAQAFSIAAQSGFRPRRSILIMPVTAEEKGLLGSQYYTEHPVFPLKNTVANLNIDMIGRVDDYHTNDSNYVYLIGSNRLSSELHQLSEQVNNTYLKLSLDYRYNDPNDPNRFYYRSDHYNFAKHNIPVIFYFSGIHDDYHKPTDTVDKLLFGKMTNITKLIFYTAWELAHRENRIKLD